MATLSEVARTGRRFRRSSEPDLWYWLEGKEMYFAGTGVGKMATLISAEMVVATDWEVEPIRLMLTAADIISYARNLDDIASKRRLSTAEFARMLCKELGLIEEDA